MSLEPLSVLTPPIRRPTDMDTFSDMKNSSMVEVTQELHLNLSDNDQDQPDQQSSGPYLLQQELSSKPDAPLGIEYVPTRQRAHEAKDGPEADNIPTYDLGKGPSYDNATSSNPVSQNLNGPAAYTWLKDLSTRMSSLEDKTKTSITARATTPSGPAQDPRTYMYQTIPEVRDCDWEHFKNRFPEDEGVYAIEVLLISRYLHEDIESEQLRRLTPEKKVEVLAARKKSRRMRQRDSGPRSLARIRINSAYILASLAKVTGNKLEEKPHTLLAPFKLLMRYHKQMEAELLRLKHELETKRGARDESAEGITKGGLEPRTTVTGRTESHTTSTPSKGLELPKGQSSETSTKKSCDPEETLASVVENKVQQDKRAGVTDSSQKAAEDMGCYIDFMRKEILPLHTMFDVVDLSKPTKVCYSDLWSLFRVGELVILRPTDDSGSQAKISPSEGPLQAEASQDTSSRHLVGRVLLTNHSLLDRWDINDLSESGSGGRLHLDNVVSDEETDNEIVTIGFFYIDYAGEEYKAVYSSISIHAYVGSRDINLLRISPLRLHKDHEQIERDLQLRGEEFHALVSQSTHANLSYKGWTLTQAPLDEMTDGDGGDVLAPSIHVDSDIIVDFREAYNSYPSWKPKFSSFERDNYVMRHSEDRFPVTRWADTERTKAQGRDSEIVIYEDSIDMLEADEFLDTLQGRFLMNKEDWTTSQFAAGNTLSKEDLVLLPSRLFAYSLRDRKFVLANLRCIQRSPKLGASSTFDRLKISDQHKRLIESVVFEHFEKKEAQKQGAAQHLEISDQDFIRGKGRGLVILLHGAPGVGKTATAEAVAIAYNKPLFPITCGNLGIEPGVVEQNLTELFRLASLWDCILLLDEAEIFLSPRERKDDNLQRNAIVSVFLRILEYYAGVLFLTTNRSGALDEAVKSRVHLSLLYPHLGYQETMSLFKMNVDRLKQIEQETAKITGRDIMTIEEEGIMDFAKKHFAKFDGKEDSRWNGRQIRNAFQIAASLAKHQHHRQPHRGLYVGANHFEEVEDATFQYDEFRNRTAMKTESQLAFSRGDRGPDMPQAQSPAPDWQSGSRRSTGLSRNDSAASTQMSRVWTSDSNMPSLVGRGGNPRDSRSDYVGSPATAWSQSGGPLTPSPSQARGNPFGPRGPNRAEVTGDQDWDQRSRGLDTAGHPPEDTSGYQ